MVTIAALIFQKWAENSIDDFLRIIDKHDIFALVETDANYETDLRVNNFKHLITGKCGNKKSGNRFSGGLSIYISQKVA